MNESTPIGTAANEPDPCPNCGRPLPGGALAGLCPACLLEQGAETEPAGTSAAASASRRRFEPPPPDQVAALFPQLEIVGLLGAGGMGAVYHARQPELDRLVALKILPPSNADGANFADRFNREARALARLSHPNIVAIYEFGRVAEWPYFIMEYVDGANLRQLEKAGRLSPREALQIIPQICDALQYAHDEGVVHRDIKPENVLIDRRGRVKIADFGLAKILETDAESFRLTAEGQVMGTPHYMAPEQVERPLAVDHRADIYSLGVVFYEMLTGDLPLGKFAPPSRKVHVDVRLDEIVLRALENDPERRYQQASEVKQRVETVVDTPASPAAAAAGNRKPAATTGRGRRALWVTALAVLAAVFVSSSLFMVHVIDPLRGLMKGRPRVHQQAALDPVRGTMTAHLPGQGTVELLAIAERGAGANQWWRPDGAPESSALYDLRNPAENVENGRLSRDVLFRVAGLPAGADGPVFDADPASGHAAKTGAVFRDGSEMPGVVQARFAWPADARKATLRAGVALDPWRTIHTYHMESQSSTHSPLRGDPRWNVVVHSTADGRDGAQVTLLLQRDHRDWRTRVVAVDAGGAVHDYRNATGTPSDGAATWTYQFHGLPLSSVKEFRVEVCPVHWIEFRNVPLHPRSPLPPPQPRRFYTVIERTFDALIDFDTGDTAAFPFAVSRENENRERPDSRASDPSAAPAEDAPPDAMQPRSPAFRLWTRQHGYDAAVGTGELQVLDATFAAVPDDMWDTLTAQEVVDRHYRDTFTPRALSPHSETSPFRTYVYRTREDGFGLLQFVRLEEGGSEVTLRLKRVDDPFAHRPPVAPASETPRPAPAPDDPQ